MEEEKKNKKQIVPIIVAVTALVVLVLGATYAYFAVGATNNFGTSTINATADDVGNVILNGSNAALSMNLKASDMMRGNSDITYYATPTGTSTDSSDAETVIGTASISPNTDTNYYHCTYTLNIIPNTTGEKNMYTIFNGTEENVETTSSEIIERVQKYPERSAGQIILTINGIDYDLYNEWPSTVNGEFYIKNPSTVDITAGLRFVNKSTIDQTRLAGTGMSARIEVAENSFSCTAEEEPTSVVTYWTYEGDHTNSSTATNKVADYRNLSNNYFIKETATQAVAEQDLYKYQEYIDGELDYEDEGPYTLTECQEWEYENDSENYGTCVRIVEANETYTKKEYEACSNYGNTLICMKETDWANSETLRTRFEEEAGLTCVYNDYVSHKYVGNTKPENGYLKCSEEDPTNPSTGEFFCNVDSNGNAYCGLSHGVVGCGVGGGSADCDS